VSWSVQSVTVTDTPEIQDPATMTHAQGRQVLDAIERNAAEMRRRSRMSDNENIISELPRKFYDRLHELFGQAEFDRLKTVGVVLRRRGR